VCPDCAQNHGFLVRKRRAGTILDFGYIPSCVFYGTSYKLANFYGSGPPSGLPIFVKAPHPGSCLFFDMPALIGRNEIDTIRNCHNMKDI